MPSLLGPKGIPKSKFETRNVHTDLNTDSPPHLSLSLLICTSVNVKSCALSSFSSSTISLSGWGFLSKRRPNRKLKKPDSSPKLILKEVIGLTTKNANRLASKISNPNCVYVAGCVVVVYNVELDTPSHLMVSNRTFELRRHVKGWQFCCRWRGIIPFLIS